MKSKLLFLLAIPFLLDLLSGCTEKCPPTEDYYFNYCDVEMKSVNFISSNSTMEVDSIALNYLGLDIELLTDLQNSCAVPTFTFALNELMALSCTQSQFYPSFRIDSLAVITLSDFNEDYPAGSKINDLLTPSYYTSIEHAIQRLVRPPFEYLSELKIDCRFDNNTQVTPGTHSFKTIVYLPNDVQMEDIIEIPYLF